LKQFIVSEDNISLFLSNGPPLLSREFGLRVKVQPLNLVLFVVTALMIDDVLEESGHDLLSGPERPRLDDGRWHRDDLVELAILKELS
jgi:hypothetical protein